MPKKTFSKLCYVVGYPIWVQPHGRFRMPAWLSGLMDFPTQLFEETVILGPELAESQKCKQGDGFKELEILHAKAVAFPAPQSRPLRWLRQFPVIWRHVGRSELVCANIPEEASFLAAIVCRIRRKPLLVQIVGDWGKAVLLSGRPGFARRVKAAFAAWMARFTVRSAQLAFAQGTELFQKFSVHNPAAVKSSVVHTTLHDSMFFEQRYRAFHRPLRLLSVCRLTRGKGLDLIVRAVEILQQRGAIVEWWCVGDGPERTALQNLARSSAVSASIRFFGSLSGRQLLDVFRDADIFVLSSYTEGIPNSMLEAMAQSLPVVVSAVGGIPGILEDGVHALLIAPGSAEAVATAVLQLKEDQNLADGIRQRAYSLARKFRMSQLKREHTRLMEQTFGIARKASTKDLVDSPTELLAKLH